MLLTQSALEKVEAELDALIIKRKEISEEIKKAREFGDLSENAEYHAAREAQSHNETEILRIREILENYELVEESDGDTVSLNTELKILYVNDNEEDTIKIVSTIEAEPFEGKLSNESPIGSGLIGRSVGETVEIQTPGGLVNIKILDIL
ncbi:transcription elongation factor GreA [Fusibacter sp. JL216-2]|uniref:transcription elongation factor GreA n=1 Tax=Fusibacter sp. JL216-2 TaxID=3071453 RepID=UPI003D32A124